MLIIDRKFRHVGRLKRASGTDDPVVFALINAKLLQLQENGDIETLRAIKQGSMHPLQLIGAEIEVSPGALLRAQPRAAQVVYVVHRPDTSEIKIGVSNNMEKRMAVLQNANGGELFLLATMPGGIEQETWLHQQWRHCHKRGEWFHATPELLGWAFSHGGALRESQK